MRSFSYTIICMLLFSVTLIIINYLKNKDESRSAKLYKAMLIVNFISLVLELISLSVPFINRFYIFMLISFTFIFSLYTLNLYDFNKTIKINFIIYIVTSILALALPFNTIYIYYFYLVFNSFFLLYIFVTRYDDDKHLIIFLHFILIIGIIVESVWRVSIFNTIILLILFIMYHTMENPDSRKLLNEIKIKKYYYNKDKNKTEFLNYMSHEVRTYLSLIIGLSDVIKDESGELNADLKDDVNGINYASYNLYKMLGKIYDIDRIEKGKIKTEDSVYNFKKNAEDIINANSAMLCEKNVHLNVEFSPNIPYELVGDPVKVGEIINNLLYNACYHTISGEINFRTSAMVYKDKCSLIISINDTGKGFKNDELDKLFYVPETGLGLTIAKDLVKAMGGKITVSSIKNKGTSFVVILTQKVSSLTGPDEVIKITEIKEEIPSKNVLIVDDKKDNVKMLKKLLKDYNFNLDEAYNGKECIKKVSKKHYDLILMDIKMPVMGGVAALKVLKRLDNFKTPVVALTADARPNAEEIYLKEGFNDYVSKPFSKGEIEDKVEKFLGNN